MAKHKSDISIEGYDTAENGDFSMTGGFQFPEYGGEDGYSLPVDDFSMQNYGAADDSFSAVPEEEPQSAPVATKKKAKKRRRRKESDFFYINRKLPCFLMFFVFLLAIAVIGISVLGAIPSMKENKVVGMLLQYTAIYRKPDMTPKEERKDTTDENGKTVKYVDKSEYIGFFDILMGTIKSVFKIGTTTPPSADTPKGAETVTNPDTKPGEEPAKAGGFSMDTPFYDSIKAQITAKGYTKGLPLTIANYFGFALILFVVVALYYMLKAFAALFGKRVFKHFGWGSILMLLSAVVVIVGSISVTSIFIGEAGAEVKLQFGTMMEFLSNAFSTPPVFKFTLVKDGPVVVQPFVAGYGLFILLALPVVTLLLSMTARKKIPYSIFD